MQTFEEAKQIAVASAPNSSVTADVLSSLIKARRAHEMARVVGKFLGVNEAAQEVGVQHKRGVQFESHSEDNSRRSSIDNVLQAQRILDKTHGPTSFSALFHRLRNWFVLGSQPGGSEFQRSQFVVPLEECLRLNRSVRPQLRAVTFHTLIGHSNLLNTLAQLRGPGGHLKSAEMYLKESQYWHKAQQTKGALFYARKGLGLCRSHNHRQAAEVGSLQHELTRDFLHQIAALHRQQGALHSPTYADLLEQQCELDSQLVTPDTRGGLALAEKRDILVTRAMELDFCVHTELACQFTISASEPNLSVRISVLAFDLMLDFLALLDCTESRRAAPESGTSARKYFEIFDSLSACRLNRKKTAGALSAAHFQLPARTDQMEVRLVDTMVELGLVDKRTRTSEGRDTVFYVLCQRYTNAGNKKAKRAPLDDQTLRKLGATPFHRCSSWLRAEWSFGKVLKYKLERPSAGEWISWLQQTYGNNYGEYTARPERVRIDITKSLKDERQRARVEHFFADLKLAMEAHLAQSHAPLDDDVNARHEYDAFLRTQQHLIPPNKGWGDFIHTVANASKQLRLSATVVKSHLKEASTGLFRTIDVTLFVNVSRLSISWWHLREPQFFPDYSEHHLRELLEELGRNESRGQPPWLIRWRQRGWRPNVHRLVTNERVPQLKNVRDIAAELHADFCDRTCLQGGADSWMKVAALLISTEFWCSPTCSNAQALPHCDAETKDMNWVPDALRDIKRWIDAVVALTGERVRPCGAAQPPESFLATYTVRKVITTCTESSLAIAEEVLNNITSSPELDGIAFMTALLRECIRDCAIIQQWRRGSERLDSQDEELVLDVHEPFPWFQGRVERVFRRVYHTAEHLWRSVSKVLQSTSPFKKVFALSSRKDFNTNVARCTPSACNAKQLLAAWESLQCLSTSTFGDNVRSRQSPDSPQQSIAWPQVVKSCANSSKHGSTMHLVFDDKTTQWCLVLLEKTKPHALPALPALHAGICDLANVLNLLCDV